MYDRTTNPHARLRRLHQAAAGGSKPAAEAAVRLEAELAAERAEALQKYHELRAKAAFLATIEPLAATTEHRVWTAAELNSTLASARVWWERATGEA